MNYIYDLNASRCNAIENDVVRMGHNLAHARDALTLSVQVRVFSGWKNDSSSRRFIRRAAGGFSKAM